MPVNLPPGLYKNGTVHQAIGRWYDANLVRFFDNTIRPVGGWRRLQDGSAAPADFVALSGLPRAAIAYRTDAGGVVQVFATTQKLYAIVGGVMKDITPAGFVAGATDSHSPSGLGNFGNGPYGTGFYGTGSQTAALIDPDTWQLTSFGNQCLAVCTSDTKLYLWTGNPAVLPTVPAGAPATATGVVVTPERFVFALGAGGNERLVQWPSQETTTDWTPTAVNTAGDFELSTSGRIICGRPTRGQTLLWTDSDLHTATYIGGTFVYRFDRVGENCGILAPAAVVSAGGRTFWMGKNGFFEFDGFVKGLSSDVQDYVFGDFNYAQAAKCWAMSISEFNEVWFFYPSSGSAEIDRYAAFNYDEQHWTVGKLARTAGYDEGAVPNPVMAGADGFIYEHELLDSKLAAKITVLPRFADNSTIANDLTLANGELSRRTEQPYLESGPFELGDGDRVMRVQRVLPDARVIGDLQLTMYGAFDQTSVERTYGPYSLSQPTPIQIVARQIRFRISELVQEGWRIGTFKLGVRESSRR